jgi:hypothetical protein
VRVHAHHIGLADPVPDANANWTFREALKRAGAVEQLFAQFDATLRAAGFLAMGGQIVDATILVAPQRRNTEADRAAIKAGEIPDGWAQKPAKLRQKDRDARWTVKLPKARPREHRAPQVDLAIPASTIGPRLSRPPARLDPWLDQHACHRP